MPSKRRSPSHKKGKKSPRCRPSDWLADPTETYTSRHYESKSFEKLSKKTPSKKNPITIPFPNPDLTTNKESKLSDLGGCEWSDLLTYRYLELKHREEHCVITPNLTDEEFFCKKSRISLTYTTPIWSEKRNTIKCPAFFKNKLCECKARTTRYIVFPFAIHCDVTGGDMHQNMMLYDKHTNSLERFEPYGKDITIKHHDSCFRATVKYLDDTIDKFFKPYLKHTKYIRPIKFPSFQGLQEKGRSGDKEMRRLRAEGFCATWSAWYADLMMSNAKCKCRKRLLEVVYNFIREGTVLTRFINAYGHNIQQFLKDYQFVVKNWKKTKDKLTIANRIMLVDDDDRSLGFIMEHLYEKPELKARLNNRQDFLLDLILIKYNHWEFI